MSYRVRTDAFEGPFDLLLHLVTHQKVDIGAISLVEIVDQYLAYVDRMADLDLDVASDFLLVASQLLQIKAMSLLPEEEPESAEAAPAEGSAEGDQPAAAEGDQAAESAGAPEG